MQYAILCKDVILNYDKLLVVSIYVLWEIRHSLHLEKVHIRKKDKTQITECCRKYLAIGNNSSISRV